MIKHKRQRTGKHRGLWFLFFWGRATFDSIQCSS